jgi:response regulator of citrate/malate metabolism
MSERRDRETPDASQRLQVNFQEARRRIEALQQFSTSVRARALAAYVGVFDFADANGCVEVSSDEIASSFRISRVSWLQYRGLLETAGLLEVQARHGGVRRGFRLVPPVAQRSTKRHEIPLR